MRQRNPIALLALSLTLAVPGSGQAVGRPTSATAPPPMALAPATKLEGFKPAAGSVLTVGYTDLGTAGRVKVEVREMKDSRSATVRGLVVEVNQSEYRSEESFVDPEEIPELLKAVDALLGVTSNPTKYKSFEVEYTTRGELSLAVRSSPRNPEQIIYTVQAGRGTTALALLDQAEMRTLRELLGTAAQQLAQ